MQIFFLNIQLLLFLTFVGYAPSQAQEKGGIAAFTPDSVIAVMYRVNDHFLEQQWKRNDRNWIRGTYYTGLMAFYQATEDHLLLQQAVNWSAKHGWRTGTEWIYPANRMTCVQTYLEVYFIEPNDYKIANARDVMDNRIGNNEPASEQGWDYVDALYVGTPAYVMMSEASGEKAYAEYGHKMFRDVYTDLFDEDLHLFYRDEKAKRQKSRSGKKVIWSRGNGWAFASIPRILDHLPQSDTNFAWYLDLFKQMASSIRDYQGNDGFWRTNLADPADYPEPESSGTAFFTYALAWGINKGYLNEDSFLPVVNKAWLALYNVVDENGKVCRGQTVARAPGNVQQEGSHEFVSGAFLLAGSEMVKLLRTEPRN